MYGLENKNQLYIDQMYVKRHLAAIEADQFNPAAFYNDFLPVMEDRERKYKQYTTKHNAIDDRKPPENSTIIKAFNQIHNSFYNLIVDQKAGYLFGNPITYTIEGDSADNDQAKDWLDDFLRSENMTIKNTITGTQQAACGTSFMLFDIESDGQETRPTLKVIDSWFGYVLDERKAAVYIEDDYVTNIGFMRYLHLITPEKITTYRSVMTGVNVKSDFNKFEEKANLLKVITLAEFKNNADCQSDFETVEDLIDSYDRTVSATQDEIEEFRWAYLLIFGTRIDEDEAKKILGGETGVLNIRDPAGSANFLTKDLPVEFINTYLKMITENIFKFSKSIDVNDPAFAGGSESGEARKWKLIALEFKANMAEVFYKAGLNNLFGAIAAYMNTHDSKDVDAHDIRATFTRTLPVDLSYLAGVISQLGDHLTEEKLLSMLPIVEDPEAEAEAKMEERQRKAKIQATMYEDPYTPDAGGDDDEPTVNNLLDKEKKAAPGPDDEKGKSNANSDKKAT
ncbi:phage portal protein [Listeria ilorinensis]|uniref:phage portal protein n=1 Tax=Listeria ilorinensis TaxID=2867439 RepID=UPI001EF5126E|nr:phage portal protein [Listeria ilorinensis]